MLLIYLPNILIIILILYLIIRIESKYAYIDYFCYDENNKDEKFEKIYFNFKNKDIENLEKYRKEIKRNIIVKHTFFIALIFITLLTIIFNNETDINLLLIIKIMILQFSIAMYIAYIIKKDNKTETYKELYKKTIISNFINLYNKELTYKSNIEEQEKITITRDYSEIRFLEESFDLLKVNNYIYGELDNATIMNFYDISIEKYYNSPNTATIFKGTYVVLDIGKCIPGCIKISINKAIHKKDRVELDSSKFEEYFDVYSEDKILSVRMLTSDVMQMLVDFYEKYGIDFEIALNNKVHINLFTGDIFKAPIWNQLIDKNQIYVYYVIWEFVTALSKKINELIDSFKI